jgi:hypothetical protein
MLEIELLFGTQGKRERKRERECISTIVKYNISEGCVLKAVEKCGG